MTSELPKVRERGSQISERRACQMEALRLEHPGTLRYHKKNMQQQWSQQAGSGGKCIQRSRGVGVGGDHLGPCRPL